MSTDPQFIELSRCGHRRIVAAWIVGVVAWSAAIGVMVIGM